MGIPILSEIERLINEHGSAAILKERLELANDQYTALERKLAETNERAKGLESEVARLRPELEATRERLHRAEQEIAARRGQRLDETRERILRLLSEAGSEGMRDERVAASLGIKEQVATFHLNELATARFVSVTPVMGSDFTGSRGYYEWRIGQEGRAYLAKHGLL